MMNLLMTVLSALNHHILWKLYGNLQRMSGPSEVRMLNEDYRDILQIFIEEKVEFLLVGAYALAVHGLPRATGDIDLFIKPDKDNSDRVYRALGRFGAPLTGISREDFMSDDLIFQIGVVPRRIDIITSISGVGFDEAFRERMITEVDGIKIPVISIDKLIKNKEASGRDKDIFDVKILKKHLKQQ